MRILFRAIIMLFVCLTSCKNDSEVRGNLLTLDVEKAIDNRRSFVLDEISENIEFIPLDDKNGNSLVGDILMLEESKSSFYVSDDWQKPVKVFDKTGRFLSTRGQTGRGPGEYIFVLDMAVDHRTDIVYMNVKAGSQGIFMYDQNNRMIANTGPLSRNNITEQMSYFDDHLIVLHYPYHQPEIGDKINFIDIFSSDLKRDRRIDIPHKITNTLPLSSGQILSNNGKNLLVKDELNDTLFHYRKGELTPAYKVNMGKYYFSQKMWDIAVADQWNKYYLVSNIFDSDCHMICILTNGYGGAGGIPIVFDKRDPSDGFMAVGQDGGEPGLFIDGVEFKPMYIRDNRLVGYMHAFDIVDNSGLITNPDLKALASTLKEDSNPVIVVAALEK